MNKNILVVDLDNSLLKIDLFLEGLIKSLFSQPTVFFKSIFMALKSKATAKSYIAKNIDIETDFLPFNKTVLNIIDKYRENGYQIILATGAPSMYVTKINSFKQLFDNIISTGSSSVNIVGANKLEKIKSLVGDEFIYIGDSKKDLPIWCHCKKAILVGFNQRLEKNLIENGVEIIQIINTNKSIFSSFVRQIRLHQWAKNFIILVPPLASFKISDYGIFKNSLMGFFSFSFLASSIYIMNDIIDLDQDRKHPTKKYRPIANGDLQILYGLLLIITFTAIGLSVATNLGDSFLVVVMLYIFLNIMYTSKIKKMIILDVITLMSFYNLRLIAGHVIDGIPLSTWLLSFSIFLFFSLGLVKRYADIKLMETRGVVSSLGRGYSIVDNNLIFSLGVSSGVIASFVLVLYTSSNQIQQYYSSPMILVSLAPLMLYWISRLWIFASRGIIKNDPVKFTLKDKHTYIVGIAGVVIVLIARYIDF